MVKDVQYQELPQWMQKGEIKPYIELLNRQKASSFFRRAFNIIVSAPILLLLSPIFLLLAAAIRTDSRGSVFYRQVRVGRCGRDSRIFKFRSVVQDADKRGLALTTEGDPRIARVGRLIRRCHSDEFSQILNVLEGVMSLVGPRPEVRKYIDTCKPEYLATLLMPPDVTAVASVRFENKDELPNSDGDPEEIYIHQILPEKMRHDLEYLDRIPVWQNIKIMAQTILAMFRQ